MEIFRYFPRIAIGLFLSVLSCSSYAAEKMRASTTVSTGIQQIHYFLVPNTGAPSEVVDARATTQFLSASLAVNKGRFFGNISTEVSNQVMGSLSNPLTPWDYNPRQSTTRGDYSISAGVRIGDRFSVYGGLTSGQTLIGSIVAEDAGPFIGTRYTLFSNSNSSLFINAGYANLAGTISFDNVAGSIAFNSSGTTSGFNYGITWLTTLDGGRSIFLRLKNKDYKTTGTHYSGGLTGSGIRSEHSVLTFSAGIAF